MQRDHARLHRSLAVLGPPRRFQLMLLLLSGIERSVSQLARAVRLSQSCTTRHLQALERAGLVKGTRDGKRVVFRPAPRDVTARAVLDSLARSAESDLLHAGIAAGAIPVASAAELEPIPAGGAPAERIARSIRRVRPRREAPEWREAATVEVAAPRPEAPEMALTAVEVPRAEPEPTRAEPESGNTSGAYAPPRRHASDIEDYLL
jgi:DNA-binding transcriptional ArsR family regulator